MLNMAEILGHDGEATPLFAPGGGCESLEKDRKVEDYQQKMTPVCSGGEGPAFCPL